MITFRDTVAAAITFEDVLELKSIMYYMKELAKTGDVEKCKMTEDAEKWYNLLNECINDYICRPL